MTRVAAGEAVTTLRTRGARAFAKVGEAAQPWLTSWRVFAGVAAVAVVLILIVGRQGTFYNDEHWFVQGRSLADPAGWFRAHVEHWPTVHVIAYRLIVETFGTGSYLPFMVALMVTHVAAAAGLFVLLRRISEGWTPIAGTALFLFLGSGYFNLFWGFQIGMVGAMALGLWALVALPTRPLVAVALLAVAVATTGNALFMAGAALVYSFLTNRRYTVLFLLPFAAYGAWYLTIGRATQIILGDPLTSNVGLVVRFPFVGLASWLGGLAGVGTHVGLGLLAAVPVLLWYQRATLGPLQLAALGGLGAQTVALTVSRALVNLPSEPHYVYMAAPWLLLLLASLRIPARRYIYAWALIINIAMLIYFGTIWTTTRPLEVLINVG